MADIRTPYDDLPVEVRRQNWGWFGEPWLSGICYDDEGRLLEEMRKPFPAGQSCLQCGETFDEAAGDSGQAMPFVVAAGSGIGHVHKECQLRSVLGSVAHLEGRCSCYGGSESDSHSRQDALAVWEWVQVHGVNGD